jgi:putative ABC transport system substrate-binding protein
MRRRDFLALVGGAAAWPTLASGQSPERVRSVVMIVAFSETDAEGQRNVKAFRTELQRLGWTIGEKLRFDVRWGAINADRANLLAAELTVQRPDLIVAHATVATRAVAQQIKDIPIVFTNVSDPIAEQFIQSFARPGRNITGFTNVERTIGGKYLELLKEIVPGISRAVMVFNPESTPGRGSFFFDTFEAAGGKLAVQVSKGEVTSVNALEDIIRSAAREHSGLVVIGEPFTNLHRARILELASQHNVPAVCPYKFYAENGCLISYGVDFVDQFQRTASYVDRILRGDSPAALAVQSPVKFEMAINMKTAKVLGVSVPPKLLFTADEVIE